MKVIKNVVRNQHGPEGCITEGYILEEAVEFCSEFLCGVDPIGLGCEKLRDDSDNSENLELGRPLSSGVTSIPQRELLHQAHRYVLENTADVQPYIEKHLITLQRQHQSRSKNQKWIQDEHNRTFISWLREKVGTELATGDVQVSDNLRRISHGPNPVVTTYNSYAINGCYYHTKSHDKNKTVQNSGVSIFKCDWVEKSGGIKTDELEFVLVDLSRVQHKNDSFILATQVKQVFFVEHPSDSRWPIVLTSPQRDFDDQYNDDELGYTVLNCQGMPKATLDIESRLDLNENTPTYIDSYTMELPTDGDLILGLDEVEIGLDNAHTDQLKQVDSSKNEKKKTRGLTLMHDVTRIMSMKEKTVVDYNENGVPIGENGHKLQSFIGYCVHHHIPITHALWKDEILDKSPNDALSQALGTPKYGSLVRGVSGFITPTIYFHKAKPRKSNKVDTTQQIIDENEALRKCIRELEQKVQNIPTSEHGSCSKSKVQEKEKVLENVVKEKKRIATSVPSISLTSKKKVTEEEEVIATRPSISNNEIKASRLMTKKGGSY
ncbi:transposase [Cucumis melo var. makuwa]|uniref:Transposase n=1 Tax=Cucumis melo var. makuwa TaxID=1194695 RepID=A0A5D3DVF6_CUCMM|nr:transposase [Cucumis melo var. makuwa]